MEKLKIKQTIKEGFMVLVENPIIFVPGFLVSFLSVLIDTTGHPILCGSINFLASTFVSGLIIRYVYEVRKKIPSWKELIRFVSSKYIFILIASVICTVTVAIGFIFLVIPGFFLMIKLTFFEYGILLENEGILQSIKRSWGITKGNWWRIFAVLVIFPLIFYIPFFISLIFSKTIQHIVNILVSTFFFPFIFSLFTFAYLQLKQTNSPTFLEKESDKDIEGQKDNSK